MLPRDQIRSPTLHAASATSLFQFRESCSFRRAVYQVWQRFLSGFSLAAACVYPWMVLAIAPGILRSFFAMRVDARNRPALGVFPTRLAMCGGWAMPSREPFSALCVQLLGEGWSRRGASRRGFSAGVRRDRGLSRKSYGSYAGMSPTWRHPVSVFRLADRFQRTSG
jgi:hypothetical protein